MFAPERLTGVSIHDQDLRATRGKAPPANCQFGSIEAERQAPDMVLRPANGEPPLPGLAIPQLDIRTLLAHRERTSRTGGDPASVGAESDRDDASGRRLQREALVRSEEH